MRKRVEEIDNITIFCKARVDAAYFLLIPQKFDCFLMFQKLMRRAEHLD